jgi:sporulation integral membrane protein YlbJ
MKMKVKIINLLVIISCLIVLFEVIFNRIIVFDTISYSLNMWINSIIPSLAPFFIISDILINYNITNYIPKFIRKFLTKLFNVSDNVLTIFFLSIVSGFPTSARNVKTMYEMGIITNKEASHALTFTHFSNPLFILGTVSVFFLHNDTYGLIILISHYISNIILGIILRKYNTISKINYNNLKQTKKIFSKIFINSIKKSIDTLLMILGTLTCFLVLSTIIINKINLNLYNSTILKGILEITMGLKSLANLNIPDIYKVVISSMFISFGGLSVHMQVLSFLVDTDISYKPFFISRIIHFTIAGIISYLLFIIII